MALVSGPRQVGKTTARKSLSDQYLNWDNADDRRRLLRSPAALAAPGNYHRGRSRFAIEAGPAQLYRTRPMADTAPQARTIVRTEFPGIRPAAASQFHGSLAMLAAVDFFSSSVHLRVTCP